MLGIAVLVAGAIVTALGVLSALSQTAGLDVGLAVASAAHAVSAAGMVKRAAWARAAAITLLAVHFLIVVVAAALMLHVHAFGGGFSLARGSGNFDPVAFTVIVALSGAALVGYGLAMRSILTYAKSRFPIIL